MKRRIILPRDLNLKLTNLTNSKNEVKGALFYRQQEDMCPLEAMFILGEGNEGHVDSEHDKIRIANEFLKVNPSYNFVEFHTHSRGTIQKYGESYAYNFSKGDTQTIKKQIQENKRYIAMLVTPRKKLLCGLDNPDLYVLDKIPNYQLRKEKVKLSLKRVAENLGISL